MFYLWQKSFQIIIVLFDNGIDPIPSPKESEKSTDKVSEKKSIAMVNDPGTKNNIL